MLGNAVNESMQAISLDRLVQDLSSEKLVFIGDLHSDRNKYNRHNELKLIDALADKKPLKVFLEHFDYKLSSIFKSYFSGQLNEKQLCQKLSSIKDIYDKEYMKDLLPILKTIKSKNGEAIPIGNDEEKKYVSYEEGLHANENKLFENIVNGLDLNGKLNIVIVGQAHIRELGLPYKIRKAKSINSKVISHESNTAINIYLKIANIKENIVKINRPLYGGMNYLLLGEI